MLTDQKKKALEILMTRLGNVGFLKHLQEMDRRIETEASTFLANITPLQQRQAQSNAEDLIEAARLSGREYNPKIFESLQGRRALGRDEIKGPKRKPGPKGPRDDSIRRRTAIRMLNEQGITGLEAAKFLTSMKNVPIARGRYRTIYKSDWVLFFCQEQRAFRRQWDADLKRSGK